MSKTRTRRPIEFYQRAWELYHANTSDNFKCDKAVAAFEQASKEYNVTLSGCMTKRHNALSYMSDDVKRKVEAARRPKNEVKLV